MLGQTDRCRDPAAHTMRAVSIALTHRGSTGTETWSHRYMGSARWPLENNLNVSWAQVLHTEILVFCVTADDTSMTSLVIFDHSSFGVTNHSEAASLWLVRQDRATINSGSPPSWGANFCSDRWLHRPRWVGCLVRYLDIYLFYVSGRDCSHKCPVNWPTSNFTPFASNCRANDDVVRADVRSRLNSAVLSCLRLHARRVIIRPHRTHRTDAA